MGKTCFIQVCRLAEQSDTDDEPKQVIDIVSATPSGDFLDGGDVSAKDWDRQNPPPVTENDKAEFPLVDAKPPKQAPTLQLIALKVVVYGGVFILLLP
ncbi:hypothetical protein CCR75_008318 [Bremia lactucae]|uniref:Uncharacterized protein n=1 Tax=Bremia lactucae TaxID=4779 RepID=A0A976ICD3_BRELC|nr:hypothetical protein CCR75_008318 [Bremia lactucae]